MRHVPVCRRTQPGCTHEHTARQSTHSLPGLRWPWAMQEHPQSPPAPRRARPRPVRHSCKPDGAAGRVGKLQHEAGGARRRAGGGTMNCWDRHAPPPTQGCVAGHAPNCPLQAARQDHGAGRATDIDGRPPCSPRACDSEVEGKGARHRNPDGLSRGTVASFSHLETTAADSGRQMVHSTAQAGGCPAVHRCRWEDGQPVRHTAAHAPSSWF